MSDQRTDAQRAADEAIEQALIQHMEAYSETVDDITGAAVLKDWVFAYAGATWADDGDQATRYGTFTGPRTASYSAMGLVQHLSIYLEAQLYETDDGD
jgi:hypothetical protein